jgi:hypothetical protein
MAPWEDQGFPADDLSLGLLESSIKGEEGEEKVVWLRQGGGEIEGAIPGDPLFGGEPPSPSDVLGNSLSDFYSRLARAIMFWLVTHTRVAQRLKFPGILRVAKCFFVSAEGGLDDCYLVAALTLVATVSISFFACSNTTQAFILTPVFSRASQKKGETETKKTDPQTSRQPGPVDGFCTLRKRPAAGARPPQGETLEPRASGIDRCGRQARLQPTKPKQMLRL